MTNTTDIIQFLSIHYPVSLIYGNIDDTDIDTVLDSITSVLNVDSVDLMVSAELDAASHEEIREFCAVRPFGSLKLVVINLKGSSAKVQSSLVSLLEYPITQVKFVLFSDESLSPLLASRCQVLRLHADYRPDAEAKSRVLKALAAASLGERAIFEEAMKPWGDEDTRALREWAYERLSDRPEAYTNSELTQLGFSRDFARDLLVALGVLSSADSRRSVYSILSAKMLENVR